MDDIALLCNDLAIHFAGITLPVNGGLLITRVTKAERGRASGPIIDQNMSSNPGHYSRD